MLDLYFENYSNRNTRGADIMRISLRASKERQSLFEISPALVTITYIILFITTGLTFLLLNHFWGELVLLKFSDLNKGPVSIEGLSKVWPVFLWAIIIPLLSKPETIEGSKFTNFAKGIWASVNAGIWEELIFRWIVFFQAMIMLVFFNMITFGYLGKFYIHITIPIVNWISFGALSPQLLSDNWVFGAAILSSAVSFRNAHKGNGLFCMMNAWVMGLVLFWLVFNYGILTAIAMHIIYDSLVFTSIVIKSRQPKRSRILLNNLFKANSNNR